MSEGNILVVDDELGPRESLRIILKPHYNVYAAESGKEAIEIVNRVPIDLVTLDLRMPDLPGTEVLGELKRHDPDIEAIIITGYGSMVTAVEGLRLGTFDYISKPFNVNQILDLSRLALDRRKAKIELRELHRIERSRAEKAEGMNRIKRQLLSALAHDIKNPLGLIMGYAECLTMRLEARGGVPEDIECLSNIRDNAEWTVKFVTGFIDASKLEAGFSVARKPVQINRVMRELGQQQMTALREKNLTLNMDLDDSVHDVIGDETQLERVLWNLLGNAVKFTPAGGKVTLASRQEKDHVCVKVIDTGMGIPQDEQPLLFSEFRRLQGSGRIEGTGLGLFIVKTIVEAHGGKVDVESSEGGGSTFSLRFPLTLIHDPPIAH